MLVLLAVQRLGGWQQISFSFLKKLQKLYIRDAPVDFGNIYSYLVHLKDHCLLLAHKVLLDL